MRLLSIRNLSGYVALCDDCYLAEFTFDSTLAGQICGKQKGLRIREGFAELLYQLFLSEFISLQFFVIRCERESFA